MKGGIIGKEKHKGSELKRDRGMRKEKKRKNIKNRACEKGLVKKDKIIGKGKKNRKRNLKMCRKEHSFVWLLAYWNCDCFRFLKK